MPLTSPNIMPPILFNPLKIGILNNKEKILKTALITILASKNITISDTRDITIFINPWEIIFKRKSGLSSILEEKNKLIIDLVIFSNILYKISLLAINS